MRPKVAIVAGIALAAAAMAVWLFPHAFPIVAIHQSLTRDLALAHADSFFQAHALAPAGARTAVRFQGDDSLRTFVELAGGGSDSLEALVRGKDIAPFTWSVRAFIPSDPREARVDFAPDGRVIGFERRLAEADPRPSVTADSGRRLAEQILGGWINDRADRWKLVASSYETQKTSGRVDRTYTFERTDRRIGGSPIRAEAVISGDRPSRFRSFVEIPQSFLRRYDEMRSWNDLIALLASVGMLGIAIIGVLALLRSARERRVRWREAMLVGSVLGALMLMASLNQMPGSWFEYDTAMSPATFRWMQVLLAVVAGAGTALLVGCTLVAAEAATRQAFPLHLDWWKLWRYRGTREVACRVGGGYAVAAIGFAYVTVFYLVTRTLFGWWVPAELLDDPNQIASPLPWITGLAMSAQAGVWEEALFRALPLSLLSLWVGQRPGRRWWMAAGVVVSALIFGFAHANYQSWPPYSRGVEMFLEASFWAILFLQFGLLVTVLAHFIYDFVLFGIFATAGDATQYRVTAAIIMLVLLAPALAVLWRWARQGRLLPAPREARFSAWTPSPRVESTPPALPDGGNRLTRQSRRIAVVAAAAGVVAALGGPARPTLGPEFTVQRGRVAPTADSMLRARGGDAAGWMRLTAIGSDTLQAWPGFVRQYQIFAQAERLAWSYEPATWWAVRYVHIAGLPADRAEEWRVRVWPDGRPLDARHILPDSAPGRSADSTALRRIAGAALTREGIDASTLRETEFQERIRPARLDVRVTYSDTAVKLPAGAAARVRVVIAGDQPISVRRLVELPETFLRADRASRTNRMVIGSAAILLLLGFLITGAIIIKRRLAAAVHDGLLNRRSRAWLIAGLALLAILTDLNAFPSALYSYDTATPWSTFVGTTVLGVLAPIIYTLVLVGLLHVLDALRRRRGIPMMRASPSTSAGTDMLILGLGLGGVIYAATALPALMPPAGLPAAPSTALDNLVPVLAEITALPQNAITAVLMVGIPILVVVGLTQHRTWRAIISVAVVILVAAIAWSLGPAGALAPPRLALLMLGVGVSVVAVRVWGAWSAWSWIVAALSYEALGALRTAVYGPEWQARGAGVLAALGAAALIALIVRRGGRHRVPA
jgi:hypothetical protein